MQGLRTCLRLFCKYMGQQPNFSGPDWSRTHERGHPISSGPGTWPASQRRPGQGGILIALTLPGRQDSCRIHLENRTLVKGLNGGFSKKIKLALHGNLYNCTGTGTYRY